jgi:hypothetical protein
VMSVMPLRSSGLASFVASFVALSLAHDMSG